MNKKDAQKRIEKLRETINHHRYLYHVLNKEEISSSVLDSLKKELYDLELDFPDLVTPDSPTQRVEGKPLKEFEKIKHYKPMLSFQDAFSEDDMKDFEKRMKRITREDIDYFCELKIDGLAIELVYENDILVSGSTRGDGLIGEDVTQNIKTIEAIPLKLSSLDKKKSSVVVRGEVFISKNEFIKLNKEREIEGLSLYANPRNIAAGSIRQLDPQIARNRNLDFFAYDLVADTEKEAVVTPFGAKTHQEKHIILRKLGFKTVDREKYCKNLEEVFSFYEEVEKERDDYSYQIDGIAVFVNDNAIFEELGVAGKAPRGGIAYKFSLEQGTTIIEDISFQVGRTGAVTPVAILKQLSLGGVMVSRATLHNEDEIKRLGIKIKDTVIVGRAGDVIPQVLKVIKEMRTGKEKLVHFPTNCPLCNNPLIRTEEEARWYCKSKDCKGTRKEKIYHLVSKKGFDIDGLGKKIVEKLFDEKIVSDPADIFYLKEGDILPLERFAEKSVQNIIEAINKKKKIKLSKFLQAISIPYVGERGAQELSYHFHSLENIEKASVEEILSIEDLGPVTAESVYAFFKDENNQRILEKLKRAGVVIEKEERGGALKKKTFVITGTLETLSREDAEKRVVELGGRASSSVSKNTTYLVVGKSAGSKLQKAEDLGVEVINEEDFLKIIGK